MKLVFVGSKGFGADEILNTVAVSSFVDDIIVTGYVSNHELNGLYKHATAFIFPSLYEGFGIPVIEAMNFGLPLILSNIPTNTEIAADQGLFFQADNEKVLSVYMKQVSEATTRRQSYSAILARYSLENMLSKHIEAYQNN